MNDFKSRFAYARNKRNYTQAALAKAIGVTRSVISNIEYGKTNPPQITVNAICEALLINKEWLENGTGEMDSVYNATLLCEIGRASSELTEAQQMLVLDIIKAMQHYDVTEKSNTEK